MTLATDARNSWKQFLEFVKVRTSPTAYGNWLEPIRVVETSEAFTTLEVPNIFVQEYLLTHYKKELCAFLPVTAEGEPAIRFVTAKVERKPIAAPPPPAQVSRKPAVPEPSPYGIELNPNYRFETFIEGPANQFVKSAAMGIAAKPGRSYNPLFIHGNVGLGKSHILHSIGHDIRKNHPNLRVVCITTEQFINDFVDSLRNKRVDKIKRLFRQDCDVLLVDDIQFLQNRRNFEEEFCNTFEALYNQKKQIVITSDKPPSQLKLSERMTARMEWGLVAQMGMPEIETRVAILQSKANQKGLELPSDIAFYIAEHIYNNVRQLEGAVNRLSAHSRLLNLEITPEFVEKALREMFQYSPNKKVSVEQILKCVATVFQVRLSDLKSSTRTKEIALPRQVAMYLACKLINESLQMIGASFGKTHSTLLHARKAIKKRLSDDDQLRRQINIVERNIAAC